MTTDSLMESVQQLAQELDAGHVDAIGDMVADEFYSYTPPEGEMTAAEMLTSFMSDIADAFPDLNVSVNDLEVHGEHVHAHVKLSGTKTGSLWGTPGTGQTAELKLKLKFRPASDGIAFNIERPAFPIIIGAMRQLDLVNPPDMMDQPPVYPATPPDYLLQLVFNGQMAPRECEHLQQIQVIEPQTDVCRSCVESGDFWPALRMCLTCGFVGCCDTSKNKHMKLHYEATGHALMRSIRLDEGWMWCYEDNAFFPNTVLKRHQSRLAAA